MFNTFYIGTSPSLVYNVNLLNSFGGLLLTRGNRYIFLYPVSVWKARRFLTHRAICRHSSPISDIGQPYNHFHVRYLFCAFWPLQNSKVIYLVYFYCLYFAIPSLYGISILSCSLITCLYSVLYHTYWHTIFSHGFLYSFHGELLSLYTSMSFSCSPSPPNKLWLIANFNQSFINESFYMTFTKIYFLFINTYFHHLSMHVHCLFPSNGRQSQTLGNKFCLNLPPLLSFSAISSWCNTW